MKKELLVVLCIGLFTSVNAQTNVGPTEKVLYGFNEIQLKGMDAPTIEWVNFLGENMCIVTSNPEKAAGLPDILPLLKEGENFNADNALVSFNPFLFEIELQQNANQYFRIGNTGLTVFVYSKERLDMLYARYNANKK